MFLSIIYPIIPGRRPGFRLDSRLPALVQALGFQSRHKAISPPQPYIMQEGKALKY